MSSDYAIKVSHLSKSYQVYGRPSDRLKQMLWLGKRNFFREVRALKDVSFQVERGQTIGIIGRNGSGKSTLLQLIAGTLNKTSGDIKVNGRVAALLELGSGFNPEFTGRENVHLNATILGLSDRDIAEKYDSIVEFSGIGEFIEQPLKTFSSGMVLRLAFAVIAHVDADILMIDEALAVGDAFFRQKCMRFLREFKAKGTILFVSHDAGSVINLCDSAIWLDKGSMLMQGSPKDLSQNYLRAVYEGQQGESQEVDSRENVEAMPVVEDYVDMRQSLVNQSTLRNDIELFRFNRGADSFGKRGGLIEKVCLCNVQGDALSWVVGGELVELVVIFRTQETLFRPIVGFLVKDHLGQELFGDNTFLTYREDGRPVVEGERARARFSFRMPNLPVGDYAITVALADGSQTDHVQHDWIHEALLFTSHSSSVATGLVGVPMRDICIESDRDCFASKVKNNYELAH